MPRKPGTTVFVRSKWPMMLRWKGTVVIKIWWQILLMGVYSLGVLMIRDHTDWKMNYSLSLVSVMGMVVSLLLVFRTNTAYDRYWEGRRLWSQMTLCIRNLTRSIWVCVAETETRDLLEKKSAINLLVAFAYATKHYLREEYGYNYEDMVGLLTHIPKYSIPISTQQLDWRDDLPTPHNTVKHDGRVYHLSEATPQPNNDPKVKNRIRKQQVHKQALAYDFHAPTNIPVEISYYIASYIKSCSNKARVDASTLTVMNNALVSMMDCLTGFERILRTPIPLAYSIHLHHGTWIYLLSLPFQLVANLGPLMIPAVMLASFTLLGILGIGFEIENPFNDDYNDLPLDDFCKVIQAEVTEMIAHRAPVPSDWVFTDTNFPLSGIKRSAKELSAMTLEQVHELMKADHIIHHNIDYSRPVQGNNNGAQLIGDPEQEGTSSVVVVEGHPPPPQHIAEPHGPRYEFQYDRDPRAPQYGVDPVDVPTGSEKKAAA